MKQFFTFTKIIPLIALVTFAAMISASCTAGEVVAKHGEQLLLGKTIKEQFNANRTAITSWSGTVKISKITYTDSTKKKAEFEKEYTVDFLYDCLGKQVRYIVTPTKCFSYENDVKKPHTLIKEAFLCRKDVTYIRESYSPASEVPDDNKIHFKDGHFFIRDSIPETNTLFDPFNDSFPFSPSYIDAMYDFFDISEESIQKMRESGLTEEYIKELCEKIKEGKHPHCHLERDGDIVSCLLSETHIQVDMNKKAFPIFYSTPGKTWQCQAERVSNVWVPQSTREEYQSSDGTVRQIEMIWSRQKVNQQIPDKEFTLPSLGLRQGDDGYDFRTETLFKVEGEEYLPPEGMELPSSFSSSTYVRIFLISIGALMAITGGINIIRKRMRKLS
ncbi:MAG: hypothetical protein LBJ67_17185 [Planctomycetaceae bacterium]|nr:hypothetical protein [Planctomycetaceae bacterium]